VWRLELFGSDEGAETRCSEHVNETFGSMKASKEENHYNIAVMSFMQCRMVMQ
jgi:hypothetical protein